MAKWPDWRVAVLAGLGGTFLGLALRSRRTPSAIPDTERTVRAPQWPGTAPSRPEVLEPLTSENLKGRTSEIFSACYFTSIAIIQGVALALLMTKILPFSFGHEPAIQRFAFLGRSIMGLVSIITVSYEYLWFTIVIRWAPTFLDTLVPYLLGVGEIAPLILLRYGAQWWLARALFLLTAILAFSHTFLRSSPGMFSEKPEVYPLLHRLLIQLIGICLAILAIVVTGAALSVSHVRADYPLAFMPWALGAIGLFMVTVTERGLNAVYDAHGVPRRWILRRGSHPRSARLGVAERERHAGGAEA